MFKMKAKKNTMELIGNSLKEGRHILTNRIVDGMKYTARWTQDMSKNPAFMGMKDRIVKNPAQGALILAGLGLTFYGLSRFLKK